MAELPGFTRGLTFVGRYALVGLSQVRESVFDGLPLTQRGEPRRCGVWIIDTSTGQTVGFLQFEGSVREVFDVQVLEARMPEILELDDALLSGSFVVPDATGQPLCVLFLLHSRTYYGIMNVISYGGMRRECESWIWFRCQKRAMRRRNARATGGAA